MIHDHDTSLAHIKWIEMNIVFQVITRAMICKVCDLYFTGSLPIYIGPFLHIICMRKHVLRIDYDVKIECWLKQIGIEFCYAT